MKLSVTKRRKWFNYFSEWIIGSSEKPTLQKIEMITQKWVLEKLDELKADMVKQIHELEIRINQKLEHQLDEVNKKLEDKLQDLSLRAAKSLKTASKRR